MDVSRECYRLTAGIALSMLIIFVGLFALVAGVATGVYQTLPLIILFVAVLAVLVFVIHAERCRLAQRGILPRSWAVGCEQSYVDPAGPNGQ